VWALPKHTGRASPDDPYGMHNSVNIKFKHLIKCPKYGPIILCFNFEVSVYMHQDNFNT